MKDTLFLHMGPGMSACPERRILGEKYGDSIVFWDQPHISGTNAFSRLVEATTQKILELNSITSKPIHLVAHSFGGNIVKKTIENIPDKIGNCTLFSCNPFPEHGFFKLAKLLTPHHPVLAQFADIDPESRSTHLWELLQALFTVPHLLQHYWGNPRCYSTYNQLTSGCDGLHFPTFQDVLDDYLKNADRIPKRISWKGKAKLILGRLDPILELEPTHSYWSSVFDSLEVEILEDVGHYTHLEPLLGHL